MFCFQTGRMSESTHSPL